MEEVHKPSILNREIEQFLNDGPAPLKPVIEKRKDGTSKDTIIGWEVGGERFCIGGNPLHNFKRSGMKVCIIGDNPSHGEGGIKTRGRVPLRV